LVATVDVNLLGEHTKHTHTHAHAHHKRIQKLSHTVVEDGL